MGHDAGQGKPPAPEGAAASALRAIDWELNDIVRRINELRQQLRSLEAELNCEVADEGPGGSL